MRRYTVGSQRRKWKRIRKVAKAMEQQGEYQHPELLFNGEVSYWTPLRWYARTREDWLRRADASS